MEHVRGGAKSWRLAISVLAVFSFIATATPTTRAATEPDGQVNVESIPARTPDAGLLAESDAAGNVVVEIIHELGSETAVTSAVVDLGGVVLGNSPGVLLVEIPSVSVSVLTGNDSIGYVRSPLRSQPAPEPDASSASLLGADWVHITATNADAWHDVGEIGSNVKVGIIDYFDGDTWARVKAAGFLPDPSGTFCRASGIACDIWSDSSDHGPAVAEAVHDMAPGASLYLARAETVTDVQAAVDWFDAQGVQIITQSLGWPLDGPGDGSGLYDAVADDAVGKGMIWFNSAGNHATTNGTSGGGYWRGTWNDTDGDGWLNYPQGGELLGFSCGAWIQGFRWSDWQSTGRTDYDIFFMDAFGNILASSEDDQSNGYPPIEILRTTTISCTSYPRIYLAVKLYGPGSGTGGDVLEFMTNGGKLDYSSNPYSATQPFSDSANAGVISVGAIDPGDGTQIAPYSSQGPTNDGRIKPDLTAPSCIPSSSYDTICFDGTSASAPVVAGAAALIWGAGVATTVSSVAQYLRNHTVDRGVPGPDPVYGLGQLVLGNPPPPPDVFIDDDDSVFEADINWMAATGITKGCNPPTNNRFCPDTSVTRGQMAAFLVRALDLTTRLDDPFVDDDNSIFEADIERLAAAGITKGCNPPTNNKFCPDAKVSREQMAAFLVRALGYSDDGGGNLFIDDGDSIFESDIDRLATAGVTKGCNPPANSKFCPSAVVTRGVMAAFLHRALG